MKNLHTASSAQLDFSVAAIAANAAPGVAYTRSGVARVTTERGIVRRYSGRDVPLFVSRSGLGWIFRQTGRRVDGGRTLIFNRVFHDQTYGSDLLALEAARAHVEDLIRRGVIEGRVRRPRQAQPAAPQPARVAPPVMLSWRKRFFLWLAGA